MTTGMPSITGLAVHRQDYPAGQEGVDRTINKVVSYILEGRHNALAKQFAEGIVQQAGYSTNDPLTNKQAAQAFLDFVRANVRYRPDPHMTETVQNPTITLCVPGASACIPVEDCDGGTAVLGWLNTAYGTPVRLVIQHFNSNTDHVLLEIQDDNGQWLACDFSNFNSDNMPVGWKPSSESEYRIDPFDSDNLKMAGARDVEFVAVGRVPHAYASGARFLGKLPPKRVVGRSSMAKRRVGYSVTDYSTASTDLANQFTLVVTAGDTYLAATPPEYDAAVSAYQAAGEAGATSVGPAIDSVGSPFTKPLTHQAWLINASLAAVPGGASATLENARQAQAYAKQMGALYTQAIALGINPPPPGGVAGTGIGAVPFVIGAGIVGGVLYAMWKAPR